MTPSDSPGPKIRGEINANRAQGPNYTALKSVVLLFFNPRYSVPEGA